MIEFSLVYNAIKELFEIGYPNEYLEKIVRILEDKLQISNLSLSIYEERKNVYRVIAGKDVGNKIPADGRENIFPLCFNEKKIGAIFFSGEVKDKRFLYEFSKLFCLTYDLFLIEKRREKLENILKLTDVFEKSKELYELERNFVKEISLYLPSDLVMFVEKIGEDYRIKYSEPQDFIGKRIPGYSDFALFVFKQKPQILIKPNINFLGTDLKVKSLLTTPVDSEKWLVFINKKHGKGYIPDKSYEVFDLDLVISAVKRFNLGVSRLTFYKNLKSEIEKLNNLKKEHEQLIENQKEQLRKMSIVHYLNQAMRSSNDPSNVLKIFMIGLTSGRALGFNRALLLLKDNEKNVLIGKAWIGPANEEEVDTIWKKANQRAMKYADIVQYLREESLALGLSNELTKKIKDKMFPYRSSKFLERAVVRRKIVHVNKKVLEDELDYIISVLDVDEFVIVPLIGKNDTIGVVILDNKYSGHRISNVDIEILRLISDSAGLAIENALNYKELKDKTLNLEKQKSLVEFLKEFSDLILQNLSAAVVVIRKDGIITEWNSRAEYYFGRNKEQMLEKRLANLGTEFEDIESMAFEVLKMKEEIKLSNYLIPVLGQEKYFDVSISPLWDAERLLIKGVIVTFEDVTERVILEKERKKQEKLAALGEMAARVVHELRNPISVLGGFVKRLEKYIDDDSKRRKYIKIISDEIVRLEGIVSEILEFSRDKKVMEFAEFNLNELITEVYILFEDRIKEKNILFEFKTDNENIEVYADKQRIKQVLINLLQNAIDETPYGGKILIEVGKYLSKVRVKVWNQGTPIPKDVLEKLFIPFFTTKVHGTGLGLPICKKIVEDEHNGKIWVEPDKDGNAFIFELPLESEDE
ncbi:histidine kinase [Thermosipho melanesiensis]|uniref:histidine kinase n=2 Tax=Thermosipho melanesiensis TaxID=46541 RepID=A6LJQ6_THEM4|nr:GAF domain-containing sensor histidine kinase [Thermosipho melanesiensis]ABR30157.1 multi-sensor signal transduction histidine kinase [Thermosipho melanesiensis BI429]APT73356.1 histidine kinase [Thermosipho melanesiensis]OOC38171.1 histidine kinase [Thermosipho melanesiensis]OOC40092.1 histidine kinase [Thermosipho melanesiensis]OOC40145.1 histidine kinase [Thermosipho melanesiensis]